jgi:ATP-dependent Clp protease ATP-binding subunit ClpC
MAKEDREITYEKMKDTVMEAMKKAFRPEFLNRVDEIIVFHALTDEELKQIAGLIISDTEKNVQTREMDLKVDEAAKEIIVKEGYEPKFGARPLRRAVQRLIENPLSNDIISGKFKTGDAILAKGEKGKITFEKCGTYKRKAASQSERAEKKPAPRTSGSEGEQRSKRTRKKT